MSKKKTNNKFKNIIIPIIIGFLIGIFLGVRMVRTASETTASSGGKILYIFILWVAIIFSLYIHVILHELGHLVFGLISGYKFVSFRVGQLMFIKEDGKLKRKKFSIIGTGGQCLMMPPQGNIDECPFILYNIGGALFNLIPAIIFLMIYYLLPIHNITSEALFIFFVLGILFFICNAFPFKLNNMANDGYNILEIRKDKTARKAFYTMLNINALQLKGQRLKDMPYEWFKLPENADLQNPIICTTAFNEIGYFHDKKDFDKARELCRYLLDNSKGMLDVHKKEIQCELLFYEIINECRQEEIEKLYTKELINYIKVTEKSYISRKRLLYTYKLIYEKDIKEAENKLMEFNKLAKTFPYKSEVESELEIIEFIKQLI